MKISFQKLCMAILSAYLVLYFGSCNKTGDVPRDVLNKACNGKVVDYQFGETMISDGRFGTKGGKIFPVRMSFDTARDLPVVWDSLIKLPKLPPQTERARASADFEFFKDEFGVWHSRVRQSTFVWITPLRPKDPSAPPDEHFRSTLADSVANANIDLLYKLFEESQAEDQKNGVERSYETIVRSKWIEYVTGSRPVPNLDSQSYVKAASLYKEKLLQAASRPRWDNPDSKQNGAINLAPNLFLNGNLHEELPKKENTVDQFQNVMPVKVSVAEAMRGIQPRSEVGTVPDTEMLRLIRVVEDEDGYSNVRAEPSVDARILRRVISGTVVAIQKESNDTWARLVPEEGDEERAYIHTSLLRPVIDWQVHHPVPAANNNLARRVEIAGLTLEVESTRFVTIGASLDKKPSGELLLNGKRVWGTDGSLPSDAISLSANQNGQVVVIPDEAVEDLFQPRLDQLWVLTPTEGDSQALVVMENSDAAGYYVVIWALQGGQYRGRAVLDPYWD